MASSRKDAVGSGDSGKRLCRRRMSSRPRPRRHADRDRLWPGGGCDIGCGRRRLFAAKGRPAFNPLIAHVLDAGEAQELALFGRAAERLAQAFWPGPLTLVLPVASTPREPPCARGPRDPRASRARSSDRARAHRSGGRPLAAPSANRSGRISPTMAAHVLADLDGRIDWILDAGPSRHGLELTIVACLGTPALLRPGAIAREAIEAVLGGPLGLVGCRWRAPSAPGQLISHYAPRARLRLEAAQVRNDEAALDFAGALAGGGSFARLDLSPSGDLVEAASNCSRICEPSTPRGRRPSRRPPFLIGVWRVAINDRLRRAAAPRGG